MHSPEKIKSLVISLLLAIFICSCGSVGSDGTDTIQPTIVSATPTAGSNNIDVNSSIVTVFSEPMDTSRIGRLVSVLILGIKNGKLHVHLAQNKNYV